MERSVIKLTPLLSLFLLLHLPCVAKGFDGGAPCSADPVSRNDTDTVLNPPRYVDRIVAFAGDEIILLSDLEMHSRTREIAMQLPGASSEENQCLILKELIYQKLLLDQARIDSVVASDEQVERELERRLRYFVSQIGSEQALEEYYGKTILELKTEFRELIRDQLIIQNMQQKITGDIKVTPTEVRTYFESIPEDSLPLINASVQYAQVIRQPEIGDEQKRIVREKLEALRRRILEGEDFGTLAYLYSQDEVSARKNGELGFVARGELVPEFEAVAFQLKEGEVSEIVQTKFGYHLLQSVERRGEKVNIRHILMIPQVSEEELSGAKNFLDSLRESILSGAITFEDAAAKYSQEEAGAANGGRALNPLTGAGEFEVNQLDAALSFAFDQMEPGGLSQPLLMATEDSKKAYRLVKLLGRSAPHRANLRDDYPRIMSAALAKKQNDAADLWISRKIAKTHLQITEEYRSCTFVSDWKL